MVEIVFNTFELHNDSPGVTILYMERGVPASLIVERLDKTMSRGRTGNCAVVV